MILFFVVSTTSLPFFDSHGIMKTRSHFPAGREPNTHSSSLPHNGSHKEQYT